MGRRARSRRGAFGLQGRIVGALLVTTVATLAVAALALLGPLENSLRNAELKTLKTEVGLKKSTIAKTVGPFRSLDLGSMSDRNVAPPTTSGPGTGSTTGGAAVGPNPSKAIAETQSLATEGRSVYDKVVDREKSLEFTTSATKVALLGYPDVSGRNAKPLVVTPDTASAQADPYDDVAKAFRTGSVELHVRLDRRHASTYGRRSRSPRPARTRRLPSAGCSSSASRSTPSATPCPPSAGRSCTQPSPAWF